VVECKKKLKIAIFHLAFVYSGGGERLVLEEAIHLEKLGYDVTCFAPVIDREKCFPELMRKVRVEKILPKILPEWFPDMELLSILAACVLVPVFSRRFRDFDIYFGANQPGAWIGYLLSKLYRKPYVIYLAQPTRLVHPRLIDQQMGMRLVDGFTLLTFLRVVFRPTIRFFDTVSIRGAGVVLVNGSYAKGMIEGVYGVKTVNCPAGAEVRSSNVRHQMPDFRLKGNIIVNGCSIKKPFILVTNRHFSHKKFEFAIEAWKRLDRSDVSLIITGRATEYTRKLQEQFKGELGLFFVGLVSERDLDRLYREAAVYVYPAPEEDFGMGIVEAMSRGAPVVAWGNAGPTGIISHGKDGYLARPFVISEMTASIQQLLEDFELADRLARAGREKVERFFSYERHAEILEKEIRKILAN
jgi:glycosyltransferase involved in cell wall biosynthesis